VQGYTDSLVNKLAADGCEATATVVVASRLAKSILEFAVEMDADVIAMVTHGREGVSRLLMGSVVDKVVRNASAPVLLGHIVVDGDG